VLPDRFHAAIALLPSDDQHLTKWAPHVGLCAGALNIPYVVLWRPFQPHTQGLLLQQKSYKSFVPVSNGIPLPTGHPLWPLQTSTFSSLDNYDSSGTIA
jgi:hypothetical protein